MGNSQSANYHSITGKIKLIKDVLYLDVEHEEQEAACFFKSGDLISAQNNLQILNEARFKKSQTVEFVPQSKPVYYTYADAYKKASILQCKKTYAIKSKFKVDKSLINVRVLVAGAPNFERLPDCVDGILPSLADFPNCTEFMMSPLITGHLKIIDQSDQYVIYKELMVDIIGDRIPKDYMLSVYFISSPNLVHAHLTMPVRVMDLPSETSNHKQNNRSNITSVSSSQLVNRKSDANRSKNSDSSFNFKQSDNKPKVKNSRGATAAETKSSTDTVYYYLAASMLINVILIYLVFFT